MGAQRNWPISVLPRRLPPGCRLWLYFRAPERADSSQESDGERPTETDFGTPEALGLRMSALAVFPSPREATQEGVDSFTLPGVPCFRRSADVSLQDVGPGGINEPQRGRAGGSRIDLACPVCSVFGAPQTSPSRMSALAVFPSPREAAQEAFESLRSPACCVFGAPQASPSRMSALAVFPSPREGLQ